jgi:hypothetical protein
VADVIEVDAATGIVVERDFTPEELAQREADIAAAEAAEVERQSVIAEKTAARAALLERLGITADEASLLLGA